MRKLALLTTLLLAGALFAGCGNDTFGPTSNDDSAQSETIPFDQTQDSHFSRNATYQVTIYNLSGNQPLSPPVAATHRRGMHIFRPGHKASSEIEMIAEDGNQVPMYDLLSSSPNVTEAINVGMPLTRRGTTVGDFQDSATFRIEGRHHDRFSMAAMLICTNDGFTGLDGVRLPRYGRRVYWLRSWDAGTEQNTEKSVDIVDGCSALGAIQLPGDPNGNEDDAVDSDGRILPHRGIAGIGDLTVEDHDFRRIVAKVVIERVWE